MAGRALVLGGGGVTGVAWELGMIAGLLDKGIDVTTADLFVGSDSGPMNLAVAVGTPAFAFFGVNPVLSYSRFIHPLTPPGGPAPRGMERILAAHVLEQVQPYLSRPKLRQ